MICDRIADWNATLHRDEYKTYNLKVLTPSSIGAFSIQLSGDVKSWYKKIFYDWSSLHSLS